MIKKLGIPKDGMDCVWNDHAEAKQNLVDGGRRERNKHDDYAMVHSETIGT